MRSAMPLQSQLIKRQLIDEAVDDANRILLSDVVVEALRQQGRLARSRPSMNRFMGVRLLSRVAESYATTLVGSTRVFTQPRLLAAGRRSSSNVS
jgi:hypothetical protein